MTHQQRKRTSKFLSLVLRHRPEAAGVQLDEHGWVSVDMLIQGARSAGIVLDRDILSDIVHTNDKQRFAFSPDSQRIRANQGHSVEINLALSPVEPPETLYHGTAMRFVASIRNHGLQSGSRQHVHLSADPETAQRVGQRHGKPSVLIVQAGAMHREGYVFYRSANGVWLTDAVPSDYLTFPEC